MTTIAVDAKAGVMCSDSQWTDGDECGPFRKVWRVRGELIGMAGDLDDMSRWLALYRKKLPLRGPSLSVLRLSVRGAECWSASDGWLAVQAQFAIGSGAKAARGAMAAGASCAGAVRIACSIDASSGGRVRSYRLGTQ